MLPLLPGKSTATRMFLSLVAGPTTSPCWPCMSLSPYEVVTLGPVKNTFSPTL